MLALYCLALLPAVVQPLLLYGCTLTDNLCDENEYCFPDGVFGQCYSEESGTPVPTVIEQLDDTQLELLRLELTRLSSSGQEWPDQRTQCVLAYFKLSIFYGLQYDPEFCQVRNPANIWALIQLIDIGLGEDPSLLESQGQGDQLLPNKETIDIDGDTDNNDEIVPLTPASEDIPEDEIEEIIQQLNEPAPEIELKDMQENPASNDPLVEKYIEDIVKNENPDLSVLSDDQLNELIARLFILKENLAAGIPEENGEAEEAVPLDDSLMDEKAAMLKKDKEEVGNVDTGLDNVEHKIVKGRNNAVSRVVGNRVYLKVNLKKEEQLYPLIEFLENTIALPNNLLFDDFQFSDGQLSMRISRIEGQKPKTEKRINSVEGVAQAVYKRRKDIARFSGAELSETGIGIGEESVPVESTERDWIFQPVLFICAFTITALLSVLGVHLYKNRRHYHSNIQQMAESLDGKSSHAYQELCRQRMSHDPAAPTGRASKSSSTSSWQGDETAPPTIDISTGHVVLNFLQEYLSSPSRMEEQWDSIKSYKNTDKHTVTAELNQEKNRSVMPFDENLVPVEAWKEGESAYINASFVYDDDPRQAVYMAAQSPRSDDIMSFWSAIWQNGVCLIVNLSTMEETRQEAAYWPDTGSQVHGPFEIHLVSEHIWSDDYLVRSFYLKNLQSGETRTITQFHYLSWAKDSTPPSHKSLLEFRRKVNKSYRGRSSPVLVHSWDGAGRTGAYCAVDLLCARLLRGVRQIDVAASVEHLRDQRDGMVRTADQFKLIYGCVAQEVSALLKALPQ